MQIRNPKSEIRSVGFSLIELLVVIAIIVVIVGILVPAVIMGRSVGEQAATRQLLQSISMAITVYDRDHAGYPPSVINTSSGNSFGINNSVMEVSSGGWLGSSLVCQAMIGFSNNDGENGLGWKRGGSGGITYGPYYEPSQYEIQKHDTDRFSFNDQWDQKVQYYRAIQGVDNLFAATNARFDTDHNEGPDAEATNPDAKNQIDPEVTEDEGSLRAAKFMLASPGPTSNHDDDIIVLGP